MSISLAFLMSRHISDCRQKFVLAGRLPVMDSKTATPYFDRRLVFATNSDLVGLAGGRLMLVYNEMYQPRVVLAYSMHIGVVGGAGDREWAGEEKGRQAH